MTTQLLTRTIDTQTRAEAAHITQDVQDRTVASVILRLDDGAELELPPRLSELLKFVLKGVTQGDLRVTSIPDELTSTNAADILGVSRPTLMKLVSGGSLPSHRVGTHHRFKLEDVFELREKRKAQRIAAFERLRAIELEDGIDD